jgi:PadR family transcriptional regulator PadR
MRAWRVSPRCPDGPAGFLGPFPELGGWLTRLSELDIGAISVFDSGELIVTEVRLTQQTLRVLRFLLEKPLEPRSGAQIAKATGTGSGTLYPMLFRLEAAKWLSSEWEMIDPREAARPRRRFYKLTPLGQNNAHRALAELQMGAGELAWTS